MATSGTSKSSVSRRFVARTGRQVAKYLSRPLGELDLPVIVIDGTQMAKHLLVVAIGIDTEGRKHVLGVVEASTESAAVARALLRQLAVTAFMEAEKNFRRVRGYRESRGLRRSRYRNFENVAKAHEGMARTRSSPTPWIVRDHTRFAVCATRS